MKITIDFKDPKTEKPNPKSQFNNFLIVTKEGCVYSVAYSKKHDLFNAHDFEDIKEAKTYAIYPKWWAEIPPEMLMQEENNYENNTSVPQKNGIHTR